MFIKLIILVLVVGSSGVGVLSVRQSRLQAAHETAEARLRIRKLENRTSELKAEIALHATPERIAAALDSLEQYNPAVQHPAKIGEVFRPINETEPNEPQLEDEESWILEDGTRVLIIEQAISP